MTDQTLDLLLEAVCKLIEMASLDAWRREQYRDANDLDDILKKLDALIQQRKGKG